ncbi:MAG: hypothetical protein D6737_01485 [Chloroflexi bacterium]|nr:MAG: hypothetical protein D6737_01485 [Chloroflexota bacterium]
MTRQKFLEAKRLIEDGHYDEARRILQTIDHPKAFEWLKRIDALESRAANTTTVGDLINNPSSDRAIETSEIEPPRKKRKNYPITTPEKPKRSPTRSPSGNVPAAHVTTNVTTNVIVTSQSRGGPGCLVQGIWFIFIGWWLGQIWIGLSYLAIITVIGIPLGVIMINMLPKIMTLQEAKKEVRMEVRDHTTIIQTNVDQQQINIFVRAIYLLLIGWWLTAIWLEIAYLMTLTVLLLPIGFWMFNQAPAILSLRRQ